MYRKKRSKVLETAKARISSIKSIAENLDLGNGMTFPAYVELTERCNKSLDSYNTMVASADGLKSVFEDEEAQLADVNQRWLSGIGAIYGKNSNEYVQAGGTKKTSIRRAKLQKAGEQTEVVNQ